MGTKKTTTTTTSSSNKKLTDLVPEDSGSKKIKITEELIHEEEMQGIVDSRQALNAEMAEGLAKGLEEQDAYDDMLEEGNLAGVGLVPEAAGIQPKHSASADEEDDDVEESSDDIDHSAGLNVNDFVPGYEVDDEDPEVESAVETTEEAKPHKKYSDNPKVVADKTAELGENFMERHDGHRPEITKKSRSESLGDKAFFSALNKVKKQAFSTVTIPFVNSGFFAEVQGGGIIDILQLYRDKFSDTSPLEYDIERMRTMIKGIRSTTPTVDPLQLASNIHQSDYQMLALAYAHATMKTFTIPQTCTSKSCPANFNIEIRPIDTIMNLDEINEKVATLRGAMDYRKVSLLDELTVIELSNGCTVELGHPSFMDYLVLINSIKAVAEKDENEGLRYASHMKTVSMIRRIILPDGLKTANPYQVYKALSLISEEDFPIIDKAVIDLQEHVVVPKFGVKSVKCPVCGHVNTNITIDNIDDMVFFHIMATQF